MINKLEQLSGKLLVRTVASSIMHIEQNNKMKGRKKKKEKKEIKIKN